MCVAEKDAIDVLLQNSFFDDCCTASRLRKAYVVLHPYAYRMLPTGSIVALKAPPRYLIFNYWCAGRVPQAST